MSYTKITSFATKDTMTDANPLKVVRGKEFDDEFDAITTAMTTQTAIINALVTNPVGAVVMFAGAVAPAGFLLCDGSARSRNTHTALFQAIGTSYGAGDGSTTFNVPNFSGRFPYGASIGQLGGTADAIVVAHSHGASTSVSISDPGHAHSTTQAAGLQPQSGSSTLCLTSNIGAVTGAAVTGITASASTTVAAAGTSGTNANLPPFVGISFIIKT